MTTTHPTLLVFGSTLGLRGQARRGAVRIAALAMALGACAVALGGTVSVADSPLSWVVLTLFARVTGLG